ncbi:unnamed protein product [Lactuca virosa]|uniref:Uncharacterized protein n=1 Tax=Lactuca virosa TaxID=75947 RepID=A0AAU9N1Q1_9ASTR|nr:unnamed protein product [Lactuca virosa]
MKVLNEQNSFRKPLSEEKKAKWSTWPSTLAASTHRSIQMAKLKTQLKVDAFRETQPKEILIPPPFIISINEGTPMEKMMIFLPRNWSYQFPK